jgi:hypothetical protein
MKVELEVGSQFGLPRTRLAAEHYEAFCSFDGRHASGCGQFAEVLFDAHQASCFRRATDLRSHGHGLAIGLQRSCNGLVSRTPVPVRANCRRTAEPHSISLLTLNAVCRAIAQERRQGAGEGFPRGGMARFARGGTGGWPRKVEGPRA